MTKLGNSQPSRMLITDVAIHWIFFFFLVALSKSPWQVSDIDGAYFGTTFPHLFLMTYGHLKPQKSAQNYVPRVFGFKLHKPWPQNVWSWNMHSVLPQPASGDLHPFIEIGMAGLSEVKCSILESSTIDSPKKCLRCELAIRRGFFIIIIIIFEFYLWD